MERVLQALVRLLAEDRVILPEAQAPQPDHNVHDGAYNRGWRIIFFRDECVQDPIECGLILERSHRPPRLGPSPGFTGDF